MKRFKRFPRANRRSMGASDPAMSQVFDTELANFKTMLIAMYRNKTKLIAERESLRFRYTTQIKNKITNAFLDLGNAVYSMGNSTATELHQNLFKWMGRQIPMLEYSGAESNPTYGGNVNVLGGVMRIGFLSPIADWLTSKWSNDPRFPELAYQSPQVKSWMNMENASSTENIKKEFFFSSTADAGKGTWVRGADGFDYWFTMPVSEGYAKQSLKQYGGPAGSIFALPELNAVYEMMAPNFYAVMNEAKAMFVRIYDLTKAIIRLQWQIDDSEKSLSDFVAAYSQYASSPIAADEIIRQIEEEANKPEPPVAVEAPVGSTIVEQVPADAIIGQAEENPLAVQDQVPEELLAPEQKSSKLPIYLAGAAALALLFKK